MADRQPSPALLALAVLALLAIEPARALGPDAHPASRPLPDPEYLDPTSPPAQVPKTSASSQPLQALGGATFVLREVQFEDNSVFSDAELSAVVAPYLNQPVSLADLETLRMLLTAHYRNAGYASSGALLPAQHIHDGQVTYRLIEGRLSGMEIRGTGRLRPGYVRTRLLRGLIDEPLHTPTLGDRFQLLLRDPLIERLNGTLRPGAAPGESVLDLAVTRATPPYALDLVFDNHNAPSNGAEEATLQGTLRNLTGLGDWLTLDLTRSRGRWATDLAFTLPLTAADTRLRLRYANSDASIVEEPLDDVDIDSLYETWELGIDHPVINSLNQTLRLGATLSHRRTHSWLLGQGTPFSPGVEQDGRAQVSVLRLVQDYNWRGTRNAVAVRSSVNLGTGALDATLHEDGQPDGEFVSWIGQFQYAHRISDAGDQLLVRATAQWTNDALLPMEQFSIGGVNSVRGYRENQRVRDQGYFLSLEYRKPLNIGRDAGHALELRLFADTGGGVYKGWGQNDTPDRVSLSSAGLGLRWQWRRLDATLSWAYRFDAVPEPSEHDLQDDGINFQLRAAVF